MGNTHYYNTNNLMTFNRNTNFLHKKYLKSLKPNRSKCNTLTTQKDSTDRFRIGTAMPSAEQISGYQEKHSLQ